jgi:hypothetical protein
VRSVFDPPMTNIIRCSGPSPRSTKSDSSAVATLAFVSRPFREPERDRHALVLIASATIVIRSLSSIPSMIITATMLLVAVSRPPRPR